MSLSIVTAMCGSADITRQWLHETVGRCEVAPQLVVVSNGSTIDEMEVVTDEARCVYERWGVDFDEHYILIAKPEPLGSTKPLNLGINAATGEVVACLHNDLMVKEAGWDQLILEWFDLNPQTGVAGFHGSRMLGADEIYREPYQKHQLARGDSFSNMEDAESHGQRMTRPIPVVTLDGMALIARRQDLLDWGGFDERLFHHCYDHDLCLTARQQGRVNYMLPVVVRHISGQTANMPRYNDFLEQQGIRRDQEIHDRAHLEFYRKWEGSGMLPARI